jgi:hypothetical protein
MARRRKPENETKEQAKIRQLFELISNRADRSEKTAWKRKASNMDKLLEDLRPIEDKILKIYAEEKQPLLDEIAELRSLMVKDCIHPFDMLVLTADGYVECKFCNRKIRVPQNNG